MFFIFLLGAVWMILPTDFIAILGTAISRFLLRVSFDTPYSKMLETEADEVGLELAAKSCFDVREASAFWKKMDIIEKAKLGNNEELQQLNKNVEFLSTHPSHEQRYECLNNLMGPAIKCRSENGCPPLSIEDPRDRVGVLKHSIQKNIQRQGLLKLKDLEDSKSEMKPEI